MISLKIEWKDDEIFCNIINRQKPEKTIHENVYIYANNFNEMCTLESL